jgi:alpha/beta superfamily hydrolase
VEALTLTTSDGARLEAQLAVPAGAALGVVLAHPHPLYGGSMWDGPPAWLFERLPAEGIAAIRFQFRTEHDEGRAEQLDVVAAIDALPPGLPVVLCGYSFGGWVSLHVTDPRVRSWCAIAAPLQGPVPASADPRPKHLLVPEHDQLTPPAAVAAATADWTCTTTSVLQGTDHFLGGAMGDVVTQVLSAIQR